jgi:hypothetical protein
MKLILTGALFVSVSGYSAVLLSEDYETGQIVGEQPVGATSVRPSVNTNEVYTKIVTGTTNTMGSGNAVEIKDEDAGEVTNLEYNFVDSAASQISAVRIDFSVAPLSAAGAGDDYIAVSVGEYNTSRTFGASAARLSDLRLYNDGTIDFRTSQTYPYSGNNVLNTTSNRVTIFVNDYDTQSIDYIGLDSNTYTLPTNAIAYWLNGSLVTMNGSEEYTWLDLGDATAGGTVATSEDNLGKFGFNTGTSDVNLNYLIDDIEISTITTNGGGTVINNPVAEELLRVEFEDQTIGQQPTDATIVRPTSNLSDILVQVTGSASNTVGTGNAVQFLDDNSADGSMLTYNFVGSEAEQVSAVRVDFSFAPLSTAGVGDDYIAVAVGEYSLDKTLNGHTARYIDMRLCNDGTVDFNRNSTVGGPYSLGNVLSTTSNSISIFVNDYDSQSIDYVGLNSNTYTLAANSAAYWLNGSLVLMNGGEEYLNMDTVDPTDGGAGTVGTTENNLGKFGFNTGSSDTNLNYLIDTIVISALSSATNGGGGTVTNPVPAGMVEILSEDFETGQSVGSQPTGMDSVRPGVNLTNIYTVVVDSAANTAGSGQGVEFLDEYVLDGINLEYNFVDAAIYQLNAVRVDFSFAPGDLSGIGDDYIAVALGEYNSARSLGANATRLSDMRLYNDGTVDFRNADSSRPYSANNALLAGTNTVSIIANDSDTDSIDYTGPDDNVYTLATNSIAYWLNGSLILMNGGEQYTSLDLDDPTEGGTVSTSDYNLGKFGFNSGSSDVGLNYVIDDIKVYQFESTGPEVRVHNLFQSHMMLQRNISTPIWGTATTGVTVTVYLDDAEIGSTIAGTNGSWSVDMPAHAADGGTSHTLKISVEGANDIVLSDVIYGDVYLCSGQSNMAFALAAITNYDAIADTLTNALIRHVNVARAYSETLLDEPGSYYYNWEVGDDVDNIRHFTAVGYLTALEIQAETGVPVGLLHSSYGGMEINMFLNPEGLELVPDLSGLRADFAQGGSSDLHDIYNAMIGPLVPYGICGILWYQGESDRDKPAIYEQKMRALARGWRSAWDLGDLPFYYMQLPNYAPGDDSYQLIREAQFNVLSEVNSGMAVTIDVGNDGNIHPTNKQDPSLRLAQWILADKYGQDIVYSGPLFCGAEIEGSQIRVLFDHVGSGLMIGQKDIGTNPVVEVTSGDLENFEIAGADKVFVAADAVIDFDSVVVSAPSVSSPQYVRYCYDEAPSGLNKLYNKEGLPASPFRTDKSSELQVINGTGSQTGVAPGTVIAISADAPATGKVFDRWVGAADAVSDVNSSSTTVTMPDRGVYLVATYRDSGASAYTLTVNNGIGSSTAQAGTAVMIIADTAPEGQVFSAWTGDTSALVDPSAETTSVIMPASSVSVTATYTTAPAVDPADLTISGFSVLPGGGVGFSFPNTSGYRYEVASTTNLVGGVWETRIYNLLGTGEDEAILFPDDDEAARYYRIKVK